MSKRQPNARQLRYAKYLLEHIVLMKGTSACGELVELAESDAKKIERHIDSIAGLCVTYGNLARVTGVAPKGIGRDIGDLSKLCDELGLPLISGMIINQDTKYPDFDGFGGLCRELNRYQQYPQYAVLVAQCLKDIYACPRWSVLANVLGITVEGLP